MHFADIYQKEITLKIKLKSANSDKQRKVKLDSFSLLLSRPIQRTEDGRKSTILVFVSLTRVEKWSFVSLACFT